MSVADRRRRAARAGSSPRRRAAGPGGSSGRGSGRRRRRTSNVTLRRPADVRGVPVDVGLGRDGRGRSARTACSRRRACRSARAGRGSGRRRRLHRPAERRIGIEETVAVVRVEARHAAVLRRRLELRRDLARAPVGMLCGTSAATAETIGAANDVRSPCRNELSLRVERMLTPGAARPTQGRSSRSTRSRRSCPSRRRRRRRARGRIARCWRSRRSRPKRRRARPAKRRSDGVAERLRPGSARRARG